MAALPVWAEQWIPGKCGCGARLCLAGCYCGGHITCSRSGWSPEACNPRRDKRSKPDIHRVPTDSTANRAETAPASSPLIPDGSAS